MTNKKTIHIIGYCAGIAANDSGCAMGPVFLQGSPHFNALNINTHWLANLYIKQSEPGLDAIAAVTDICTQLAEYTQDLTHQHEKFAVIGGDHSCAIGTWTGAASALAEQGPLGLIWIDAHMDAHTPTSSLTGNIHGMPIAILLGHGADELTNIIDNTTKIQPGNLCLIGIRSFEPAESDLLEELGVKIFDMNTINQRGIDAVIDEAISIVSENTAGFGVSFDVDAIEPTQAPAVGTPAENGINATEILHSLTKIKFHKNFIGCEITEFNPNLDQDEKTEKFICELFKVFFET